MSHWQDGLEALSWMYSHTYNYSNLLHRYTGDEDKTVTKGEADNILQKLHEAAEQRRRSKQFKTTIDGKSLTAIYCLCRNK